MNRELKFRAWITAECVGEDTGLMVTQRENHDCAMISNGDGFAMIDPNDNWIDKSQFTIMQYTGLKDDEESEIYEGDIVRGSYGIPGRRIQGVVEYDGSAFIVKTPGHNPAQTTLKMLIKYIGQVWVIGNIYESPELLEEQNGE